MSVLTDTILLRRVGAPITDGALSALADEAQRALPAALRDAVKDARIANAPDSEGGARAYVYLHLRAQMSVSDSHCKALERTLPDTRVARLQRVFEADGAASGESANFHYAVEMNPESGYWSELQRWYDEEHMPGLAAVPGCIRARRYVNHDSAASAPISHACYELVTAEAKGSPPWLAVSNTAWSLQMRPRFMDTIRTLFRVLHHP